MEYYGAAPNFIAGLMQVNVRVPESVAPGDSVPVQLSMGDAKSQAAVTMAVR